ncbi:MAG: ABC transporter permease [Nitrospiraceae bacterium]|nr:ABC transporter permease [Nitrospiraceae bacterium]
MTPYHFKSALAGLWKEKWINLLSTLSIAVGLFITTVGLLVVYNVNSIAQKLPDKFSITVYLKDGISQADTQRLQNTIRSNEYVRKISYISKEDALRDLKDSLKDSAYVLEGIDNNPLPASFSIKLRKDYVDPAKVKRFAGQIKAMRGVDDIQYGEQFLSSIQSIMSGARLAGLLFLGALLVGVLFVCYSTVKILFYRKADEVETLKLLGATGWFIRMPFLLEGSLMGFFGGLAAFLAGYGVFDVFLAGFSSSVPAIGYFLVPSALLLSLPAAGLFIGFSGALIALGRIRS